MASSSPPTIGVIGTAKKESLIISGPKGELYAHTAAWLRSQGYKVIRFDLRPPCIGNQWDPVSDVVRHMERGNLDMASTIARDIAHVITHSVESKNSDPIWAQGQEALHTALILTIATGTPPPGGTFPRNELP